MTDLCEFCGAPATHLCDFTFGVDHDADEPDRCLTCDAALCESCKITVSGWHWHGEVNGEHRGGFDTVDHCPVHANEQGSLLPCTAERAEEIRAANRLRRILLVDGRSAELPIAVGQMAAQVEKVASSLRELQQLAMRGEVSDEEMLAIIGKAPELFQFRFDRETS